LELPPAIHLGIAALLARPHQTGVLIDGDLVANLEVRGDAVDHDGLARSPTGVPAPARTGHGPGAARATGSSAARATGSSAARAPIHAGFATIVPAPRRSGEARDAPEHDPHPSVHFFQ